MNSSHLYKFNNTIIEAERSFSDKINIMEILQECLIEKERRIANKNLINNSDVSVVTFKEES